MNTRVTVLLVASAAMWAQAYAANGLLAGLPGVTMAPRAATLQGLARGAALSSDGEQYRLLPGARATERLANELPEQTLARVGGGSLIEARGALVVFTAPPQGAVLTTANGVTLYPTAFNPRTGGIGILPGTLNVKLRNAADAAAIASTHGLELVRAFPNLQLATYQVKPGQDLTAVAAALAADGRVVSAEVEVIENVRVPH